MNRNHNGLNSIWITEDNIKGLLPKLEGMLPIDLADFIEKRSPFHTQLLIFTSLPLQKAIEIFAYLPFKVQKQLLKAVPTEQEAALLNALSPDDRTALLEEMPSDIVSSLLKHLSPEERELSLKLLGYPKYSIGRLMTPDYIAIKTSWTVKQVLDYVREKGKDSETLNVIYAVDDNGVLVDDFRIREFLLSPLDTVVENLMDHKFISLSATDSEDTAIRIFRKYSRIALPVLDQKGVLLGIVTIDDIMQLSTEEDTEDMQKIGGVEALKEPYLSIPFFTLMHKRIGWLLVLFLGELLTASAMGYYAGEISKAVVLALFLPLIISSGGNAGSQATTLIVRALALGEVGFRDWWRIVHREVYSGIFLGAILGIVGFLRVSIWGTVFHFYGEHWLLIAVTIFFSIMGVVTWGTISGAMLPLILHRLGFDPATSSAPFVATLVDVTGLIIYFNIAIIILNGTLL